MARDIAQEIINAVKTGSPDYVVTKLVQEREDKIKNENLGSSVPTTSSILSTAAALAAAGKNVITGGTTTNTTSTPYTTPPTTEVYDSPENYDNYTLPLDFDYSSASSQATTSATGSKIVGYAVVGLVLLVVADKIMGK